MRNVKYSWLKKIISNTCSRYNQSYFLNCSSFFKILGITNVNILLMYQFLSYFYLSFIFMKKQQQQQQKNKLNIKKSWKSILFSIFNNNCQNRNILQHFKPYVLCMTICKYAMSSYIKKNPHLIKKKKKRMTKLRHEL